MKFGSLQCLLFLSLVALSVTSCHRKIMNPFNQEFKELSNGSQSAMSVDLSIDRSNLQYYLDDQLQQILAKQNRFKVQGFDLLLEKQEKPIQFGLTGNTLTTTIPIGVEIKKNIVIGQLVAQGVIEVVLKMDIGITEDWTLTTETSLVDHSWVEPLRLVSGFGISLESIANDLIASSKEDVVDQIDKNLSENVDLASWMRSNMQIIQGPITIPALEKEQLLLNWEGILAGPFINKDGNITTTLKAIGDLELIEKSKVPTLRRLPALYWNEPTHSEQSFLQLDFEMPLDSLHKIINDQLGSAIIRPAGRQISIEKIELDEEHEKLNVKAWLSGDFVGVVDIVTVPVYNNETNCLQLKETQMDIQSDQVIKKLGLQLFRKRIIEEIEKSATVEINEQRDALNKQLVDIYDRLDVEKGIEISTEIHQIWLNDFKVKNGKLQAILCANANMALHINSLEKLTTKAGLDQ